MAIVDPTVWKHSREVSIRGRLADTRTSTPSLRAAWATQEMSSKVSAEEATNRQSAAWLRIRVWSCSRSPSRGRVLAQMTGSDPRTYPRGTKPEPGLSRTWASRPASALVPTIRVRNDSRPRCFRRSWWCRQARRETSSSTNASTQVAPIQSRENEEWDQ